MVCDRCIEAVKEELAAIGFPQAQVELGLATLDHEPTAEQVNHLAGRLEARGFALLRDGQERLLDDVRRAVMSHVNTDGPCDDLLSQHVSRTVGRDYRSLSELFSATEGRTVESYARALRIERVKQLLAEGELPIKEIAWLTGFSSTAHLTRAFREATGITPARFREKPLLRTPLDKV